MGDCGCGGHAEGSGPFSEGRELVEFVYQAHGGELRSQSIRGGGLSTACQGCHAAFILTTYVGQCPACGGVHGVSPPRSNDAANIQFAGQNFCLPE